MAMGNEAVCFIYGLYDPGDGRLRYVGKANDVDERLKSHLRDSKRRVSPLYSWINRLRLLELTPTAKTLVARPREDWKSAERAEIAKARIQSPDLLNLADGGDEPYCSKEIRASNGKKVSELRVANPSKARIYRLKTEVGRLLKNGKVSEKNKQKLRYAAQKAPHLFGEYASIR